MNWLMVISHYISVELLSPESETVISPEVGPPELVQVAKAKPAGRARKRKAGKVLYSLYTCTIAVTVFDI